MANRNPVNRPGYVTAADAASILGIDSSTISIYVQRKIIKRYIDGDSGRFCYSIAEIEELKKHGAPHARRSYARPLFNTVTPLPSMIDGFAKNNEQTAAPEKPAYSSKSPMAEDQGLDKSLFKIRNFELNSLRFHRDKDNPRANYFLASTSFNFGEQKDKYRCSIQHYEGDGNVYFFKYSYPPAHNSFIELALVDCVPMFGRAMSITDHRPEELILLGLATVTIMNELKLAMEALRSGKSYPRVLECPENLKWLFKLGDEK